MNELMDIILRRRSVRNFKPDQLTPEDLDVIVQAGLHAANAGGRQSPVIVVHQDPAQNAELDRLNAAEFARIQDDRPPMKPGEAKPAPKFDVSKFSAFHNAPTVITVFAPKDWYNFTIDAAIAAENMLLAAESIGVGACMIARATETFQTPRGREIQHAWGLSDEYEAKIHVILGYPAAPQPAPKPIREGRVIMIREK